MATRPNEKGGAAASPDLRLAAMFSGSTVCTLEGPTLSDEQKRIAWDAAYKAYTTADRNVEKMRALWMVTKTAGARGLLNEAWSDLKTAADRLIRTPMPPGKRRDMDRAHYWKRQAVRRCRYTVKDDDWKELLAADKALIPPPQPRKDRRDA